MQGNYLRTPHSGRTKASYVACPAPSPPSRFTKLFTSHHHHQTRPPDISSDFFSPISHQMSSRLLIQVSLPYLSLRFRFREPPLWDSVMCSVDQIRFRYRATPSHSAAFFFEIQISDEILSAAAIADVCRLRGRSLASGAQSSLVPAQALWHQAARREQERQLQLRAQDVRK